MPLLESQESRNKRLFDEVYFALGERLKAMEADSERQAVYGSWLVGAMFTAQGVLGRKGEFKPLKEAWGKGDFKKAVALIEVFTVPMVSRWFRIGNENLSAEKRLESCYIGVSNVLAFLGHHSEHRVKELMNMVIQYNYDEDQGREIRGLVEMNYLFSLSLKACGYPSKSEISGVTFPVDSMADFHQQGGAFDACDPFDPTVLYIYTGEGARIMFQSYKMALGLE